MQLKCGFFKSKAMKKSADIEEEDSDMEGVDEVNPEKV